MSRLQGSLHVQSPLAGRANLPHHLQGGYSQQHPPPRSGPSHRHAAIDGEEAQYLRPPSPHSRLLLALLSPLKDEITWALSRLIQGSALYPEHLILSEWCGLAHRLLTFVRRLNKAARGQKDWEWDNEVTSVYPEDSDSDSEEEEEGGTSSSLTFKKKDPALFDPRHNEDHQFILNAAISASLILRNASQDKDNAEFLTRDSAHLPQLVYEILSLPEDLFGFEVPVCGQRHHLVDEEDLRLEGVRELRLYWMEILRNIASRIYLYERSDVVRLQDGSVRRTSSQGAPRIRGSEALPVARTHGITSSHYTDRLLSHTLLLFYTTGDRALLLALTRFLAQLLSNAKANPEVFLERAITIDGQAGWSPGIIGRCKELVILFPLDQELAEAAMDCLDASIDVAVEDAVQEVEGEVVAEPGRTLFPNALKILATGEGPATADSSTRQPMLSLLAQLLSVKASSWDRSESLMLHGYLHPLHLIPSRRIHRERLIEMDPDAAEKARSYHALRSIKSESGLINYTTPTEKRWLKEMEEPQRLKTWLKLVARPAGGPGSAEGNPFYITQMQIWTSYRDTFAPLIDASQRRAAQDPKAPVLPSLVPAYDVISKIGEVFPTTAAVLVSEEDSRIGGTKFVIRGLEGYLRPEVTSFRCRWRGCPQHQTASRAAQVAHVHAHAKFTPDPVKCRWGPCTYVVSTMETTSDSEKRAMLAAHTLTHLTTVQEASEESAAIASNPPALSDKAPNGKVEATQDPIELAAPTGRAMPLLSARPSPAIEAQASPHAVSAPFPSRFTVDRPSSMRFNVYRTPFNFNTGIPEGPAASAARILQRVAHMCRAVLGSGILGSEGDALKEEDDFDKEEKKVKLDFSDRLEEGDKFGMPFTLPANFASIRSVPPEKNGVGSPDGSKDEEAEESRDQNLAMEAERLQRRSEALESLQGLESIEEEMIQWAGSNDILSRQLLEALDDMACIRARDVTRKRQRE